MYDLLHNLLQDKEGGAVFSPYNLWHILYLILLAGAIIAAALIFKSKPKETKAKIVDGIMTLAFSLYMADFFIMPFSYGYIDIDKLPFHICTLMSILCFMSRHNAFLAKFKTSFTILGLIGALIYVVYPAGVANGEVSVFCYRIMQTLLFHGLMLTYGVLSLVFEDSRLKWNTFYKDIIIVVLTVAWAVIGNRSYCGVEDGRSFNWCFVTSDPLCLIPDSVAPYVMPFVVVCILLLTDICIRLLFQGIKKFYPQAKKS